MRAINVKRLLAVAVLALGLPIVGATPALAAGGPIVLTGIDAEDGGPGAHGPIANWVSVVSSILGQTHNGGDGILVIGANGPDPINFWNAIGAGTGETITLGNENSSFAGFQMIAVVGSAPQTSGGLTQAQQNVLAGRQADFAAFINAGGGLMGNDQSNFTNPFAYLGGVGAITTTPAGYNNIDPTPAGIAIGITDALDVTAWHSVFTAFPPFLQVLAFQAGTQSPAVLGGFSVVVQPNRCAQEPTPQPGDIVGTPGDDMLVGTPGPDRIFGLGGNDRIAGLGGDDIIFGGPGDDRLAGGEGDDILCGGDGRDYLSGDGGNDSLYGGAGNDDLSGGAGDDSLFGEDGDDRLAGGPGTNINNGGAGTDACLAPAAGTDCEL